MSYPTYHFNFLGMHFLFAHLPKGLCVYQESKVTCEIFHGIPLESIA